MKRTLRIAAGWTLLLLGIVGLFLPWLQGILMIVAGLTLLSPDVPWARRLMRELKAFVAHRFEERKERRQRGTRPPMEEER